MELPYENAKKISFTIRRVSLAPEYRPLVKVSQIMLILYLASGKYSANIFKLQLFNWVFKSKDRDQVIYRLVLDPLDNVPFINMDPTVNRALQFALAEKLISFNASTGKFLLLEKGIEFANSIIQIKDIFVEEKALLNHIGKKVTDKILSVIFKERNL